MQRNALSPASGKYGFGSLRSQELLARLDDQLAQDRSTTAELIALLGEVEERRLYRPAGDRSMFLYCVGKHGMSEDVACHRLRTARAARRFPTILEMIADGRLHVSGASMLSRFVTPENASELLSAAAHRSRRQIERLLAERFPRADVATVLMPVVRIAADGASAAATTEPGRFAMSAPPTAKNAPLAAQRVDPGLPAPVRVGPFDLADSSQGMGPLSEHARIAPLAPERFALQVTVARRTHDLLRYAQSLLGAGAAAGDVAEVLDRALTAYVEKLERQKLGAGSGRSRGSDDPRYIPVAVRREVWERDGGQCAFTSDAGHRCECRDGLQFDHVQPVARGGTGGSATNIRLLCAAHNRHEADRAYGAGFMQSKVEAARNARGPAHPGPCTRTPVGTTAEQSQPQPESSSHAGQASAPCVTAHREALRRGLAPAEVLHSRGAAAAAQAALEVMLATSDQEAAAAGSVPGTRA